VRRWQRECLGVYEFPISQQQLDRTPFAEAAVSITTVVGAGEPNIWTPTRVLSSSLNRVCIFVDGSVGRAGEHESTVTSHHCAR